MNVDTVLCPVDFSPMTECEVEAAVEVCRAFDARLVLVHSLSPVTAGLGRAWEWDQTHRGTGRSEADAVRRLDALVAGLPAEVEADTFVGRGPVGMMLLQLVRELPADLVVLGCHGRPTEEHASTTERLLEDCPCPVLALHDGGAAAAKLRPGAGEGPVRVLAATDFSAAAVRAVAYAVALARAVPVELHLVHVVPAGERRLQPAVDGVAAVVDPVEEARRRLAEAVPPDLAGRVHLHVESGAPADRVAELAARLDADFLVLGEHARGLVRRFFTHDTARDLLHRAGRPVFYVPPPAA
jgi:universal stress protein A